MVEWVENGTAPEAITAKVSAENQALADIAGATRLLCPYPSVARYTGDDEMSAESFSCE